jgi:hypothetical protein
LEFADQLGGTSNYYGFRLNFGRGGVLFTTLLKAIANTRHRNIILKIRRSEKQEQYRKFTSLNGYAFKYRGCCDAAKQKG